MINLKNLSLTEERENNMKYFLFISFHSGLGHNALYNSLFTLRESLEQLVDDEELDKDFEEIPTVEDLKNHFLSRDDFWGGLSNGTYFHIQEATDEYVLGFSGKELVR